jgi:NADH:ubiquinone oxidoreductase subunit
VQPFLLFFLFQRRRWLFSIGNETRIVETDWLVWFHNQVDADGFP